MKILVVGEPHHLEACRRKFGAHDYVLANNHEHAKAMLPHQDLTFDFLLEEDPAALEIYASKPVIVFVNICKASLAGLVHLSDEKVTACRLFGFNGLPTFLERELLEVSAFSPGDHDALREICQKLKTAYSIVEDRVGMVTPRIICMIINEAYYTVQEKTASRADIDLAMKLGTNYPYGPFEWCEKIGISHVYEVLEALFEDTKDERYKICALLKRDYLQQQAASQG